MLKTLLKVLTTRLFCPCGLFERSFRLCFQHPVENFPQNPRVYSKVSSWNFDDFKRETFSLFAVFTKNSRKVYTFTHLEIFANIPGNRFHRGRHSMHFSAAWPQGGVCDIIHLDERRKKSAKGPCARVRQNVQSPVRSHPPPDPGPAAQRAEKRPVRYPNSSGPAEPPSPTIFPF